MRNEWTGTTKAIAASLALATAAPAARADIVHADDVIINGGKLCVGPACADGETFGTERIKAKAANLSLLFDDTSTVAGAPANDWSVVLNDTVNGGDSYFAVKDVTGNTIPLKIEAGARTDALFIKTAGAGSGFSRVGLGTGLPETELHIKVGGTPTLRLEQDTSNGFDPRVWDIGGNAGNLFVADRTALTTPFKLVSAAPDDALVVGAGGNVGLGLFAPTAALHVRRSDGTARLHVQEASGTQAARELFLMENSGGSYFTLKNTASGRDWFFTHENAAQGRFIITSSTNPSDGLFYEPDGDMQIGGALTQNSDRDAKTRIEPVDPVAVLTKIAALPIAEWSYRSDAGVRHIGPMAQDFRAAFGTGATDTGISTLDTSGVALAAIQALAADNAAQRARNADQQAEIEALTAARAADTALIARLAARLDRLEAAAAD